MENTNVYIRPSLSDGDSIAVREAIEMNVNVVASNVTKRPEETFVYEHGNNSDFVSNVENALNKPDNEGLGNTKKYNKFLIRC